MHVIVDLNVGGAEMMLERLIAADDKSALNAVVISLTTLGVIGQTLRTKGVCVYALGMTSLWQFPIVIWRLMCLMRLHRPEVVQTWMYHADFIGGLAARLAGIRAVVWNIRSTAIPQGAFSATYWLIRLCAICSYIIPARIICCAQTAKNAHIKLRYDANKITVIPNGYDFSKYQPDLVARTAIRKELGLNDLDLLIGVVGRFDPLKDFQNFVMAAEQLAAQCEHAKFLMVGRGNEWVNPILSSWINQANLRNKFHLVGHQSEVIRYFAVMDVFCLSSAHEAFPNVLVEAMALGLPCVTTQAGDAAEILSDDKFIVPIKQPKALAEALLKICSLDKTALRELGEANAKKVRKKYPIKFIAASYDEIYTQIKEQLGQ